MKEKEKDGKGRRSRRFREAVDGPKIRAMYAKMPTKELARLLGLTVRQIANFVYRHNLSGWARKLGSVLSAENSVHKGTEPCAHSQLFNKPCREEFVKCDKIQLRKRRCSKHMKVAVFRHQIVGTCCKSTIDELVVVRIRCDDSHTEIRMNHGVSKFALDIEYQ